MKAWSFSSLTAYETCPRQYNIVRNLKLVVDPPTVHTEWGKLVHSALEFRVKDNTPLPDNCRQYEKVAAHFDGRPAFTELQLALTRNLEPTEWESPDCWVRGIIDVGVRYNASVFLGDYKTGKIKTNHDQMKLFAACYMAINPEIKLARTAYIWLAHDKMTRKDIPQTDTGKIWEDFIMRSQRLERAFAHDKWLPKPSGLCKGWCPVGKANCEFWTPKVTN